MDQRDDSKSQDQDKAGDLLATGPRVVNVGLEMFANNLVAHGTRVVHVQWSPPAGGDARLAGLLDRLRG
jgi:FdrA protein